MIFLSAYGQLVVIFLKLKRWKLLFMGLMLAATTSNLYLHKPIDSWMVQLADDGLKIVSAHDFMEKGLILADSQKDSKEIAHISNSVLRMTKRNDDFLTNCTEGPDCQEKYFQLLLGKRSGKIVHYVSFQPNGTAKIKCQFSIGTELYCPLMAYLAAISQPGMDKNLMQLNYVSTFLLKSSARTLGRISRGNGTLCMTDVNFPSVFSRTLMAQMIFVAISLVFYLLVGTVSCIYELKNTGFLQLMCRRGMPVLAYWLALWTITLIEMAIFAALLTFAHHYQCIGFYPTPRLINLFLCSFLQFCCMAALVILLTVVTRKVVIAGLLACLLSFAAVSCIVLNRIVLSSSQKSSNGLRYMILGLPFGHFAEQAYAVLLQGDLKAIDKFFDLVLPISAAVFGLTLIATLYLDYVLKTGNGLHFPHAFMLRLRYWILRKSDRVWLEEPKPSVMVEPVTFGANPTLCTHKLKKSYAECCGQPTHGLSGFSVQLHEEQITAVVGHNGSGKSALLQILSGERLPTSGKATFNNLLISDPIARYHICHEIGYCPQTDALVDQLTVRDTLKLAVSSSGLEWDGVIKEVNGILNSFQIDSKIDRSIQSLSTSDKRKVCVTMALIGKPKLILLDDPSRDMDYVAKRRMWKLLYEYRKGRVIIFSTLFIDEGEGMADRMIFMSSGRIVCAGSPFFFKRAFDCKFIVQVASKTEFHVSQLGRKMTAKFPSLRLRSFGRADFELEVPLLEDRILPAVVAELETLSHLVQSYGIVQYSLDGVFSKLKGLELWEIEDHFQSSTIGYLVDEMDKKELDTLSQFDALSDEDNLEERLAPSKLRTVYAMILAHLLQMKRSRRRIIIRAIVPCALLLLLIVGAVFEKMSKNHRTVVKFDLTNVSDFERTIGACLYYKSGNQNDMNPLTGSHFEQISETECGLMLTGLNDSRKPATATLVQLKPKDFVVGNFRQAILHSDVVATLNTQCKKTKAPCPVVYSTDWCADSRPIIESHGIHAGAYVIGDSYSPTSVSMTAMEILKNVYINAIIRNLASNLSTVSGLKAQFSKYKWRPNIEAEGVVDIKAIFFPFYGMYIQLIILAVMPAIYLNDVNEDKQSGVYKQLLSMGMTRSHYWICTFVNHWIQLAIVYCLSVILLMAILPPGYTNPFSILAVNLPTLTIGLANSLLCVFIIGSVVKTVNYMLIVVYSCFSLLTTLSVLPAQANDVVGLVLVPLLPQFAIAAPTYYGARVIHYSLSYFKPTDNDVMPSLLPHIPVVTHIVEALIIMPLHFLLLLLVLVTIENRGRIRALCCRPAASGANAYDNSKDAAVVEEVAKITSKPNNPEHIMEASGLQVTTLFDDLVLKNLTIGVKHGEVLGLLGPCGAGKGAAVRTVVGDKRPTAGRVEFHVQDRWLSSDSAMQHSFIGYCPSYDPLIEMLTVWENLEFYSRVVGIELKRATSLLRVFHLDDEASTLVMRATAGVKRRLTLAIAILPSPRFIAINEPSARVDSQGRQLLWQAIKSLASKQRGILVATQEMDEAERLCGRICIMNGGLMATINTVDELASRYKRMYFLEIQLGDTADETLEGVELKKSELVKVISKKFAGSIVMEQLTLRVQFGIPIESIKRLSSILSWLLAKKEKLHWLYFLIHFATVDQTMKAIITFHESQLMRRKGGTQTGDATAEAAADV